MNFESLSAQSSSQSVDSDILDEGVEGDVELNQEEEAQLKAILQQANEAETNEDLDTAIEKLKEYRRTRRRLKEKKRRQLRKERAREVLGSPEGLFELEEIHGFTQEDMISPQDVAETFTGYEAELSEIEMHCSPEELNELLANAREVADELDIDFKLVTRPALTMQEMAEQSEEVYRANNSDQFYSRPVEEPYYSQEKCQSDQLFLITTQAVPLDEWNYLEQTKDLVDFVQEHGLDVGIEDKLKSAENEIASKEDEIQDLLARDQISRASETMTSLMANRLLRPRMADIFSDMSTLLNKNEEKYFNTWYWTKTLAENGKIAKGPDFHDDLGFDSRVNHPENTDFTTLSRPV